MKVLFLLYSLGSGGAERVTSVLASHWAANGHEVGIVTIGGGDDFFPLHSAVRRHRLDLAGSSKSAIAALLSAGQRMTAVRRLIKAERPDAVIAMMTSWNVELALAGSGLPLVTIGSERSHPPMVPIGRAWVAMRRFTYGLLSAVVAQTERTRSWLEQHTNAREVRVIPNPCVPAADVEMAKLAELPETAPVLLAVGRLVTEKRFERLIDALRAEPATMGDWHLAIVGEGPMRAELLARAKDAGLAHRVHLPGNTTDVGRWYKRAQMLALTSDFEGFPNVLLEAMAHGLPVVATDCDTGPAELIEDGVSGILVPPGDPQALREALVAIARDPALGLRLGEQGRLVAAQHSPAAVAARWEALIDDLRSRG